MAKIESIYMGVGAVGSTLSSASPGGSSKLNVLIENLLSSVPQFLIYKIIIVALFY